MTKDRMVPVPVSRPFLQSTALRAYKKPAIPAIAKHAALSFNLIVQVRN